MANEFKAAGIYAELGFKINKQELKQLTDFKKSIQEVKKALGSKTSTAGIAKVTTELKKQRSINKGVLSDLKVKNTIKQSELALERKLVQVSSSRRGIERSAFSRAKKSFQANPTPVGMTKFKEKATNINLRAQQFSMEAKAAKAAARAVETEAHAMNRSYNAAKRRAHAQKSLNQQMREFRTTLLRSTQAYTAYATVLNTAQVGSTFEGIRAQFKSVFGKDAVSEMSYVRAEADRLGVSITDTAKAYAKFTFSAQMMGTSVDDSKKFFRQLQEAGAGLGLSNEEITGTTKAFSDMMAKGTVNKLAA